MTPEQKFSQWIIENLPLNAHIQRIESTTGSGIPDMNICWEGEEFWIETKVTDPYALLRPYQWAWINRRMRAGGTVVIAGVNDNLIHLWTGTDLTVVKRGKYLSIDTRPLTVSKHKASFTEGLRRVITIDIQRQLIALG